MRPLENLEKYDVVLASNSPRRKQLLEELGVKFRIFIIPGIDESYPEFYPAEEIAPFISKKKASAYQSGIIANELVITADTVVVCDGKVLGKPHSESEAKKMLKKLSGNTHDVITGVTITTKDEMSTFKSVTKVKFADLTEEEINHYISKYQPMDKAGAYGIQEWIGYVGVKSINGSFYNVMGLPVQKLYTELKRY